MIVPRAFVIAAIMVCSLIDIRARAAPELPYLFQRLENPVYRTTFDGLFQGRDLEPWLREYLATRNGVDTPGRIAAVDSAEYELHAICQPHNCAGNYIYVLFAPGGHRASALFIKNGREQAVFGNPNKKERHALSEAAKR